MKTKIELKRLRMFENMFSLLKEGAFNAKASDEFKLFIKGKNIEWDGDNNIIRVGKHFRIKLLEHK